MKIPFIKMHGAGNDFIMVDDRDLTFPLNDKAFIQHITSRRTGIGSDGILLIQPSEIADFRMRFINPDAGEQNMCGNGARCIALLAHELHVALAKMKIETGAGIVLAEILDGSVRLNLTDPSDFKFGLDVELDWPVDFANTGVPHVVVWVDDVQAVDLVQVGRMIRYHALFYPEGSNASFAKVESDGTMNVRTYERGVEGETMACGTAVAAAAVLAAQHGWVSLPATVHCASGYDLIINQIAGATTLEGPVAIVFSGEMQYGDRV